MTFNPIDSPVDHILLSGRKSPGLAVVSNASLDSRWDIRKGFALSGSRPVYRGAGLAHPIVTLRLFTVQDWIDWGDWKDLVQRPPLGARARAKDIWHPILEDLGIGSVVVEKVLQPKQVADGEWNIDIKFIEFRFPVRTIETIGASEERPTDPVDVYIEELSTQIAVLAGLDTDPPT